MTTTDDATRAAYIAQSEWLGASAAQQAASWLVLSVAKASAILDRDTCNDAVADLRAPDLSGEWADDLTPDQLAQEIGLTREHLRSAPMTSLTSWPTRGSRAATSCGGTRSARSPYASRARSEERRVG